MDTILDYFSRVAANPWWVVFIELILIGLVIYWVVDFLEGTRGERLFRGVLFILFAGVLILNLVVEKFQFERLEYLYKGFLIGMLIIAVAAFQPELRRVLIRIGQPHFLTGTTQKLAHTVEEIVSSVTDLSSTLTGAIIVIEKKVALGEFVETGVRIEGLVSSELLRTIFKHKTSLHDMAVIIRGERIVAARVQLPLAEAETVDGIELGSRHRAAIGISSSSDCSVIVVSEETGIVSIAESGKLTRNITETQLRKHLSKSMNEMAPIVERFWKFRKKSRDQGKKEHV